MISRGVPRTEPAFFISLLSFFKSLALMLLPHLRRDHTLHNRLIDDMQHLAANTEGPTFPQEVQSALILLVVFVIGEASHCSGGDDVIYTEVYIVGDTLSHGTDVLSMWLDQCVPVCNLKATSQGFFSFL
ncbi:hypothetical protein ILYODFUR_004286 [Ilyodon furcidens]|uniref:Uncharacterized protein n=1 Tax=Ilyodon furcidens TaxID=33524 RepID=A0ABV0TUR4_9TELE